MNIGIIGFGYWGAIIARSISKNRSVALSRIADLNQRNIEAAQTHHPTAVVTADYNDLLSDADIQAIIIATPADTHFDIAMASLHAGKHVWVEKPLAQTEIQAIQLIALAQLKELALIVDHTFLYTGAVRKIKELLINGDLGKAHYYNSARLGLGLFRNDVSVISDLAVHDFAILDYLLGESPIAVSSTGMAHFKGRAENLANITLFYESGFIANINVSWIAPKKIRRIIVGGSERMIEYNDMLARHKVKVHDVGVIIDSGSTVENPSIVRYRAGATSVPKLNLTEALCTEVDHFLTCIRTGQKPISDGHQGLRVVKLVEAATLSMKARGEPINMNYQPKIHDSLHRS